MYFLWMKKSTVLKEVAGASTHDQCRHHVHFHPVVPMYLLDMSPTFAGWASLIGQRS